jgi:hypothetical protein
MDIILGTAAAAVLGWNIWKSYVRSEALRRWRRDTSNNEALGAYLAATGLDMSVAAVIKRAATTKCNHADVAGELRAAADKYARTPVALRQQLHSVADMLDGTADE